MTYTIIISTKYNPELVFKHIKSFYAEPGRIKLFRGSWVTVENVTGLILHEEADMSRLSDDEKRYFTDQISMLKNENERLTKRVEDNKELPYAHEEDCATWHDQDCDCRTGVIENLESQIDAMRDFMALLYLGIREGRDEAFEALDDKTKHLINEVWFERLEED